MKFGIVGTNFVSDSFMQGARFVPKCDITAVCSGRKENAERFAAAHGISHVFNSFEEMVEANILDAVYIATPNAMHYAQACYFLNHKIPVFCEKPLASNITQVKDMIACAKKNQTYLHDATIPLYSPNLQLLKDTLPSLGVIRRAVLSFGKYSSRYDAYLRGENPTTFRPELSNGATMDLGVYTIADAVALFGAPKHICANAILLDSGVDGMSSAIFRYDHMEVIILNSKITDTGIVSEIQGEKGYIQFTAASNFTQMTLHLRNQEPVQLKTNTEPVFKHQLEDFISSIENKRIESACCPHSLSIDIHQAITTCREQCGITYPADKDA